MADFNSLIESAAAALPEGQSREDFRTLFQQLVAQDQTMGTAIGVSQLYPTSGTQKAGSTPPPAATVSATGANGNISVGITNPVLPVNSNIWHEVSYSTVKNFSTGVTTMPPTLSTSIAIPAPGQQLFVRVRSSFNQKNWNSYQLAQNSAVDAGLQTSTATENNVVLNQSNFATVDSIANGSSAAVRVFGTSGPYNSYVAVKGIQQNTRPSATIINVEYDSTQIVAHDGDKFQVQPILPGVFPDSWEPVGQVAVVGSGAPTLPVIVPIISGGQILGYNVTNGGAGATEDYTLTLGSVGGGSGATFGAQTFSGGVLISVAPGNPGSSYGGGTTVTASGGTFSGGTGGGQAPGGNGGRLTKI